MAEYSGELCHHLANKTPVQIIGGLDHDARSVIFSRVSGEHRARYHGPQMAQSSIIRKLERELRIPIRSERQVLYILAEIRKFIEHGGESRKQRFRLLNFFCNWVLHVDMFRDGQKIREILECFDIAEGVSLEDYQISRFYSELRRLDIFRRALGNFLTPVLPSTVTSVDWEWERFLFLYLLIVSEVPIRYTSDDLLPTDVSLLKITYEPSPKRQARFLWHVRLANGEDYRQLIDYGFDGYDEPIPDFFDGLEL